MIGLDTNIVVRFLMQDDPHQAARATAFIEQQLSPENRGFISLVVLVEIAWVLRSCYGIDRETLIRTFRALLETRQLWLERPDLVVRTLRRFEDTPADFSDALIVELAHAQGCVETVSFDRKSGSVGMRML
ncbi:MAG: PIN domain-containing protein [Gammaproteobacteria bacterium]